MQDDRNQPALLAGQAPPARQSRRRQWPWFVLAGLGALAAWYGPGILSQAHTAAAVGARVACSCRYVGGRELGDCRKDFEKGMAPVVLSDDPETRTVTARYPLLATERATFREGWGCVLDNWGG